MIVFAWWLRVLIPICNWKWNYNLFCHWEIIVEKRGATPDSVVRSKVFVKCIPQRVNNENEFLIVRWNDLVKCNFFFFKKFIDFKSAFLCYIVRNGNWIIKKNVFITKIAESLLTNTLCESGYFKVSALRILIAWVLCHIYLRFIHMHLE